jgi:hypothetical protein
VKKKELLQKIEEQEKRIVDLERRLMIAEAQIEGQKVHPFINPYPSGEPYITPPDAPQPMYPPGNILVYNGGALGNMQ